SMKLCSMSSDSQVSVKPLVGQHSAILRTKKDQVRQLVTSLIFAYWMALSGIFVWFLAVSARALPLTFNVCAFSRILAFEPVIHSFFLHCLILPSCFVFLCPCSKF